MKFRVYYLMHGQESSLVTESLNDAKAFANWLRSNLVAVPDKIVEVNDYGKHVATYTRQQTSISGGFDWKPRTHHRKEQVASD